MSSKRVKKKAKTETNCVFCSQNTLDSISFGNLLKYNTTYAHYNCLLLSSGLSQNGRDNEGMFGFLLDDINKEVKRGEKLKCSYCKRNGATIGCSNKSCKKSFHLPCGLNNKSMHQFFGNFHSYCLNHRPKQLIESDKSCDDLCPTCYTDLKFDSGVDVLSTPCCHKLFHRECLQKQALSAGYFFKCPLCNNTDEFKQEMSFFGIYVPKMDASWERDNNAFGELYERHSRCDVEICLCNNGRQFSDENSNNWKIILCNTCGSQGVHMRCALIINQNDIWVCGECKALEERAKKRNKCTNEVVLESDDDNDIEMLQIVNNPSSSASFNTNASNATNRRFVRTKRQKSRIRLSDNLGQRIEINVDSETPKLLSTNSQTETSNKKDVNIQCLLVEDKDLIDCDPIDNYSDENLAQNERIILFKNQSKDIIEIESSDEDECRIIN